MPGRQRAGRRLLLGLLIVLGILGMHGSPAMASSSMRTHSVATMGVGSPEAAVGAPTGAMALPMGGDHQAPADHHLLAPCLASAAPVVVLGSPNLHCAEAAFSGAAQLTRVAAEISAQNRGRPPPPPDLQKLCISRT